MTLFCAYGLLRFGSATLSPLAFPEEPDPIKKKKKKKKKKKQSCQNYIK